MLKNVGKDWSKETLPSEVKSAADKNKRDNINPLHKVDFIHLADFLFKPYQSNLSNSLFEKLHSAKDISEFNLAELKSYLPRSNWDRYFNKVVNCEGDYFLKRWTKLYELRCLVAHNNFLTATEYEEIIELKNQITKPLNDALNKMTEIIIPNEEKESIAENAAINFNEITGEFIYYWKRIENEIVKWYAEDISSDSQLLSKNSLMQKVSELVAKGKLDKSFLSELYPLGLFRNKLIHNLEKPDEMLLEKMLSGIKMFYFDRIIFNDLL